MKKIKLLLIAIVGLFAVSTLKVDAAVENGSGKESTSGIGYEIQNLTVNVYDTNALKNTQNGQGLTSFKSYELSDIKINPAPRIDKMKGYDLVSVKLNIEGGLESVKEKIKAKLTEKKSEITGESSNKYLVTFSVRYKLTVPESVIAIYDADYGNVFSGDQQAIKDETATATSTGLSQIIFSGIYDSSADTTDWSNGIRYNYDTHIFTSRYDEMPLFDEYLLFTQQSPQIGLEKYRFMMHEIEDLDSNYYFKEAKGSEDDNKSDNSSDKTPTTPSNNSNNSNRNEKITGVPDTDARNMSVTLFGSSLLALGSGVVLWELKKKFN